MNELIEDYQRKINTINELLKDSSNSDETINRLKIKVGCYRSFLTDINRALNIDLVMLSLSFAEWVDINCIRSGAYEWTYKGDNFTKIYSTEEMLNEHRRIINSEA